LTSDIRVSSSLLTLKQRGVRSIWAVITVFALINSVGHLYWMCWCGRLRRFSNTATWHWLPEVNGDRPSGRSGLRAAGGLDPGVIRIEDEDPERLQISELAVAGRRPGMVRAGSMTGSPCRGRQALWLLAGA
jgi:hypothetical protein